MYLKFHYYTCPANENYCHPSVWIRNGKQWGESVLQRDKFACMTSPTSPLRARIKISDLSSWKIISNTRLCTNVFLHVFFRHWDAAAEPPSIIIHNNLLKSMRPFYQPFWKFWSKAWQKVFLWKNFFFGDNKWNKILRGKRFSFYRYEIDLAKK